MIPHLFYIIRYSYIYWVMGSIMRSVDHLLMILYTDTTLVGMGIHLLKRRTRQNNVTCIYTHLWTFSKSKFNLKSDCVNLVEPPSPIECLLYSPNVRAIRDKLGPERLTPLGNSNALRLLVHKIEIWCGFQIIISFIKEKNKKVL